jgi:hypothetical protein
MDHVLLRHLRDAWRDDLAARGRLLQHLRWLGLSGLAAVLRSALGPDVVHLDAWSLGQIAAAVGLSEEHIDDIMPWRRPTTAAAAIARALQERSDEPWDARIHSGELTLIIRSAPERLDANGDMPRGERIKLARLLDIETRRVNENGLVCSARTGDLCEFVARAEQRPVVYDLSTPSY